ncbi:MAG: tRNA lysidine(34) synthetase TilS [Bacteroidales bacterium]
MKSDLLDRFIEFSRSQSLFIPQDQVVVALSGGGDSLALVDLFTRLNQPVILVHCNFKLRDDESDQDEEFVRKIAVVYDLPLYVTDFETVEYSREKGISIEMAARELRYSWFEKIRVETSSASIAVAHHADDSIETMLINLIRGTGIRGLSGIQPRQGNVIRPLLFTNRDELINYLEFRHIEYRNDSSNQDTRFIRNRIRHVIMPEFEKINPAIRQTIREEQVLFNQAQRIIAGYTELKAKKLAIDEGDQVKISIRGLKEEEFPETILFELLRPFGFHGRQIRQILLAAGSISGKVFTSRTHTLLIDRENMIITSGYETNTDRYYFDPEFPEKDLPLKIQCRIINDLTFHPPSDPNIACLDYEKLDLPLILRRWEKGDYFYPLGMDHSKKVSDFFIDQKVNRIDKNRSWILASGEQIVWILGYRIDQRFRVTDETREILEIKIM